MNVSKRVERVSPRTLVLCWVWIALCGAYLAHGYATYSGLYRWLAELQIAFLGRYVIALTGLVPFLLLIAPTLPILRRDYLAGQGTRATTPAAKAMRARRTAIVLVAVAAFCFILSGATFLIGRSKTVPAGSPVEVDLRTLGTGPPPEGRVTVRGRVLVERGVTTITEGSWQTFETLYVPIVASDRPADQGGYRVFVKRSTVRSANQPALRQMFLGAETGILVRGGLPADVLAILAQRGIEVAEPHWLLSPPGAANDTYFTAAATAGLIGLILFLGGTSGFIGARFRAGRPNR